MLCVPQRSSGEQVAGRRQAVDVAVSHRLAPLDLTEQEDAARSIRALRREHHHVDLHQGLRGRVVDHAGAHAHGAPIAMGRTRECEAAPVLLPRAQPELFQTRLFAPSAQAAEPPGEKITYLMHKRDYA
jgi:hypothetical protein